LVVKVAVCESFVLGTRFSS